MGFSLSWLAVKGKSPETIHAELGLKPKPGARREARPEADWTAVAMPNGWYLIVANHSESVAPDAVLQRLSTGGELVTCFVEEHVMVSKATGWRDGQMLWSVTHLAPKDLRHLEVQGTPPPEFAAIRDRLSAKRTSDCDYIFDIPVETARSVAGYRYDQDIAGLSGEVFEVLVEVAPKKTSLLKMFFGS